MRASSILAVSVTVALGCSDATHELPDAPTPAAAAPVGLHASSSLSGAGACPAFHCAPEASGAMSLALESKAHALHWQNATAGSMSGQGCSGDGAILACLFSNDASGSGTLKVFDPLGKTERWASGQTGSYAISSNAATGQVPFILANGHLLASDDRVVARYDGSGKVVGTMPLSGSRSSKSFGVVGLSGSRAFVSQQKGTLTSFDVDTLGSAGSLQLTSPSGAQVTLSSPASAHGDRGYLVAQGTGRGLPPGYLIAVDMSSNTPRKVWTFSFQGAAGASAVVVPAAVTGRAHPIVLVHRPAPPGATTRDDHLAIVEDRGDSYEVLRSIPLAAPMDVSPVVDAVNGAFYLHLRREHLLRAFDFAGADKGVFDVRALAGSAPEFSDLVLNGHVVGTFSATQQTVLLSASGAAGQFEMGLDPVANALRWITRTGAADRYTAAWTIQARAGGNCPIFVGALSGINVLCP